MGRGEKGCAETRLASPFVLHAPPETKLPPPLPPMKGRSYDRYSSWGKEIGNRARRPCNAIRIDIALIACLTDCAFAVLVGGS